MKQLTLHISSAALLSLASFFALAQGGASAPDVGAGQKRAAACFACHNADGISKIPGTPHLAGQDRAYVETAHKAYRDGTRQNPTMNAMAKPLSDQDIGNIAAYFGMLKRTGGR
jgi:cytochrome c553